MKTDNEDMENQRSTDTKLTEKETKVIKRKEKETCALAEIFS